MLNKLVLLLGGIIVSAIAGFWWWNLSGSLFPLKEVVVNEAGKFNLAAPLPMARTEAGGTVVGDAFYVFGGLGPLGQTLKSAMVYSSTSNNWEALPDLPQPLNHPAVIAVDKKIFIIGGFGPLGIRIHGFMFARWNPRASVYIFDSEKKSFMEGPELPEVRGAGAAALAEGAIWYVGGIGPSLGVQAELWRLDLSTMKWRVHTPMPTPRDHLRLEAINGKLFAISGRKDDLRYNLSTVERYDITTDSWSQATDIPQPRGGLASVVVNDKIYTFGGELPWYCLGDIERYDPENDRWVVLGTLPEARHGIIAGMINNNVHLVSGGRHPRLSVSGIHRVLSPKQ